MNTEYLSQLNDDDIKQIAKILEPSLTGVEHSFQQDGLNLHIELCVLEDEDDNIGGITDLYVLDDYLIEAYDVPLDLNTLFEYRRFMHEKFGDEYARVPLQLLRRIALMKWEDIVFDRFQMFMGFADSMTRNMGWQTAYGLHHHDEYKIGNPSRKTFDKLVNEVSLGRIDVSGLSLLAEELDDLAMCSTRAECDKTWRRFNDYTLIWKSCAGKQCLDDAMRVWNDGGSLASIAQQNGLNAAFDAFDAGVPLEDVIA